MPNKELAPCAAYHEMAEVLGDAWFLKPAAIEGICLVVLGIDHVQSVWFMTTHDWECYRQAVLNRCQSHNMRVISTKPFKRTDAPKWGG